MIDYRGGASGPSGGYYRKPRSRLSLSLAAAFSLALLFLGKIGNPAVEQTRTLLTDVLVPVARAMAAPVRWAEDFSEWAGAVIDIYDENERLREENARLLEWRSVAEGLDLENRRLREALQAADGLAGTLLTARVIAVQGGPYVRTVLIDAGADAGLWQGLPVVTPEGVVGRVISVGRSASRVLLITDFNSRVPVRNERTGQNGIAIGRNSNLLDLGFLPVDLDVAVGDRLLSSGDGGVFPPDVPVGNVIAVDGDRITLAPAVDLGSLDFVRVLSYDPRRVEPASDPPEEAGEVAQEAAN